MRVRLLQVVEGAQGGVFAQLPQPAPVTEVVAHAGGVLAHRFDEQYGQGFVDAGLLLDVRPQSAQETVFELPAQP